MVSNLTVVLVSCDAHQKQNYPANAIPTSMATDMSIHISDLKYQTTDKLTSHTRMKHRRGRVLEEPYKSRLDIGQIFLVLSTLTKAALAGGCTRIDREISRCCSPVRALETSPSETVFAVKPIHRTHSMIGIPCICR